MKRLFHRAVQEESEGWKLQNFPILLWWRPTRLWHYRVKPKNILKCTQLTNFGVTLYLSKTWGVGGQKQAFLVEAMAPALMQRGDPAFISTLWPPCDSSEDCHTPWWQTGLLCTASTGCHPRLWLGTFWKCQSHMIMNIKQPCIAHDYLTGGGDLTDAGERNLIASRNDAWGYWAG